jgi:hypothetical protein
MVHRIHEMIAETFMPDAPQASQAASPTARVFREPPIETLPNVQVTNVIGLLEAIADQGGVADIFELAQKIGKDFGSALFIW